MYVIRSPLGTYLVDEGLVDDRFACWSHSRAKAHVFTRGEFDAMRARWAYLNSCELVPALAIAAA